MTLTDEQIRLLFRSDAHFPARFPELARIEIIPVELPRPGESRQQKGKYSVPVLQITEVQRGFLQRVVPLSEARSIFLPYDAAPASLSLEEGEWLLGPEMIESELPNAIKRVTSRNNPKGLGITFVAESAMVLNIVSVAAPADECGFLFDRLGHDKRGCC